MYVPAHFAADVGEVRELLIQQGAADLVTATTSGLTATLLPFLYEPTVGEHGSLLGHVARNNDQWRHEVLGDALVIVRGPDAYISPSWYASKAEHGRVVPTWNYVTAHIYGRLVVHDDPDWVGARPAPERRDCPKRGLRTCHHRAALHRRGRGRGRALGERRRVRPRVESGPKTTAGRCGWPSVWISAASGSTPTSRWWRRCRTAASSTPGTARTCRCTGSRTTPASSTS